MYNHPIFTLMIFFIALLPLTFINPLFFIVNLLIITMIYFFKENAFVAIVIMIVISISCSVLLDVSHFYLLLLFTLCALYFLADEMHLAYYVQLFFVTHAIFFGSYYQHLITLGWIYTLCMIVIFITPNIKRWDKLLQLGAVMIATLVLGGILLFSYKTIVKAIPEELLKGIDYEQLKLPKSEQKSEPIEHVSVEQRQPKKVQSEHDQHYVWYGLLSLLCGGSALYIYKKRKTFKLPEMRREQPKVQYVHHFKTREVTYSHLPKYYMKHLKKLEKLYVANGYKMMRHKTFNQNFGQLQEAQPLIDFIYRMRYYEMIDSNAQRTQFIKHIEVIKRILKNK